MSVILSCARGHNASTTLMVDGEIIFYLEEERLSRRKYDGAPLLGLMKAFEYVDKIDDLVICHTHRNGPELDWTGEDLYRGWVRKLSRNPDEDYKIHFIDTIHHELHAACGFLNSGFETAACVIADGAGSFLQSDRFPGVAYEFETIFTAKYPVEFDTVYKHLGTRETVGILDLTGENNYFLTEYPGNTKIYEAVTEYCGFSCIDAGKTMGLSPYGKENPEIPEFFRDGWGNREVFVPNYPNGARINIERYPILQEDIKNHKKGEYTEVQMDMAYAVQKQTEERMVELIRKAHEITNEKNIVVCGGYGLNCVANYKYLKEFPDLNIYCEPISHDGGTSIGAAKYCSCTKYSARITSKANLNLLWSTI